MYGRIDWTGGDTVACTNERGDRIDLDWEEGPTPMQVALQVIGACSTADVVLGLKDRSFSEVWVVLDATRAETRPRCSQKSTWCTTFAVKSRSSCLNGLWQRAMRSTARFHRCSSTLK